MPRKRWRLVSVAVILAAVPALADAPLIFLLNFGSPGNAPGQFLGPAGITIDPANNIYIADAGKNVIDKFTSAGQFISSFGGPGTGNGRFNNAADVAIDGSGTIYITDATNALIQVFSSEGTFLRQWSAAGSLCSALNPAGTLIATAAGDSARIFRTADGARVAAFAFSAYFNSFEGCLAIGPSGTLYIAPKQENIVRRYSLDGAFLGEWGVTGSGPGQFTSTAGLTVDASDNVFVCDAAGGIEKFTSTGAFLSQFGGFGRGEGQFLEYRDMATDAFGNLFFLDSGNRRVLKFGPATTPTIHESWGRLKARYRSRS